MASRPGKSYVLERFRALGVAVPRRRRARARRDGSRHRGDAGHRRAVRRRQCSIRTARSIGRKLGPLVFADAAARRDLEAIVHPAVYRAIAAGLRAFELTGSRIAIVDIPLLYETAGDRRFDAVIATVCSPALQLARLLARGLSETGRTSALWPRRCRRKRKRRAPISSIQHRRLVRRTRTRRSMRSGDPDSQRSIVGR